MKKIIIPLLAASFLASVGSAQLWIENLTNDNLTFAFRSVADSNINNQYDSYAGARVTIDLSAVSSTGFTLTFGIDNLSGGTGVWVGNPAQQVDFGPGTITGFGFNIAPSFSDVSMTPVTGWQLETDSGFGGAGNPPSYDFEIGSTTTNGVNNAIDAGDSQSFAFDFTTDGDPTGMSIADLLDINEFGNALVFRFQETSTDNGGLGSDKVGIMGGGEPGGGGFGFVPEPSTYGMFGALALLGLMVVRQVRRR